MARGTTTVTTEEVDEIQIHPLQNASGVFHIIGKTGLFYNRMAMKAKQQILFPSGPKNATDRAAQMKHDPMAEYRDSVYKIREEGPTRLVFPANAVKGAMSVAALDLPSTKRTEVERLVHIPGQHIHIWGVPALRMDVVRNSGFVKAPDIRTRAYLARWCAIVTVEWILPKLKAADVSNLLMAGGRICGIGDYRQEKGSGDGGMFEICEAGEPDFLSIQKQGGRAAQDAALQTPQFANDETQELYEWYVSEISRRASRREAEEHETPSPRRRGGDPRLPPPERLPVRSKANGRASRA